MKTIRIYTFLIMGLVLSGCQLDNDKLAPMASVELSVEQLSFMSGYTGEQMITITSTGEWTAVSDKDWCTLSMSYGDKGISRIKVSVTPNGTTKAREATITVSTKDTEPKRVKVVQLGETEEIVLVQDRISVSSDELFTDLTLVTNVEKLTVAIPEEQRKWVKILPKTAVSSASPASNIEKRFMVVVSKNNTMAERTAIVTFSGGKAEPRIFTIVQKGLKLIMLEITNANVDENIGMRAEGMQIKFDVRTNVGYELKLEGQGLMEISKNENSYVVSLEANTGDARTGKIIVIQLNSDPLLSDTLTVRQLGSGEEFVGSRLMDSLALVSIYNATDMKNWSVVEGKSWAFNLEKPMNQWMPVRLNTEGRVISWELQGTQKSDTNFRFMIPEEIQDLTQLNKININSWNLAQIAPEFGALKKLDTLVLIGNMTGTIPAELGNLSSIVYLSISGNVQLNSQKKVARIAKLTGEIPAGIWNLTTLKVLRINYSKVSGSIPSEIGNLRNLEGLYMEMNNLSGHLPSEIGQLTDLEQIILSNNGFSNSIPAEFGNLAKLRYLILDRNNFSGTIPATIGNMSNLQLMHLYGNKLSGSIPVEFGNLSKIEEIILHINQLDGKIPSSLGRLSELRNLYLYSNSLTGNIPPELGNLRKLKQLVIYYNGLTGEIPASLDNITTLEAFVAPMNKLSGTVPAGILAKCKSDPANFIICPQDGTTFSNYNCN